MKLSEAKYNDIVYITKILGHGSFRKRIAEMGFVRGKEIRIVKTTPFKGPIEVKILNYNISLRNSEAELIEVLPHNSEIVVNHIPSRGIISKIGKGDNYKDRDRSINVALVGNPNCGKTTLYNSLSGSREKVGNYGGVTVEVKKTSFEWEGYIFNFYDLPGTYSLTTWSPEEVLVRKFIYEQAPDIVVNVVDATNLERNLFLTTQLIDMDLRVVIALTMFDELEEKKIRIEHLNLAGLLGIPIVPVISSEGTGVREMLSTLTSVYEGINKFSRHIHIDYGKNIETSLALIRKKIMEYNLASDTISPRFLALRLLDKDSHIYELLSEFQAFDEIKQITEREIKHIQDLENEDIETLIVNAKYGFIIGALKETLHQPQITFRSRSEKIDSILTHPVWGMPLFALILFVVFYTTFKLGAFPKAWIELFIGAISFQMSQIIPDGMLKDLLIGGIIGGTGSVLVFLPNIIILFLLISLLEETGYMARASFIMDKTMHLFGLHGRSFIPLIIGFGCNVPAIMATRTLRNRGDRILTMLIIPFMTCSARLPVYILIISAIFTSYHALYLISVYSVGIVIAFLTTQALNHTVFRNRETPFVMELPTYRMPTLKNVAFQMWTKTNQYLKKIGGIILVGVIIIWALEYFPRFNENEPAGNQTYLQPSSVNHGTSGSAHGRQLVHSYLGRIGSFIQPVMQPLGFDWKMSISLLSGLPAKEIIVSTMGILYRADEGNTTDLQRKLNNEVHQTGKLAGKKVFSKPAALSFLVFILIYFPCIGVVATIKNESGHWKWALFSVLYTTALAWAASFIVYNTANFFF